MDEIELNPQYSTREIPGRCVKCLAEAEYGNCLRELLKGSEDKELADTYEALVTFLTSGELKDLRDESERLLAEGKDVRIVLRQKPNGQGLSYELRIA